MRTDDGKLLQEKLFFTIIIPLQKGYTVYTVFCYAFCCRKFEEQSANRYIMSFTVSSSSMPPYLLPSSLPSLWPTDRFPANTRTRGEVSVIFNFNPPPESFPLSPLQKSDMNKEKGKGSEDLRLPLPSFLAHSLTLSFLPTHTFF